MYMCKSAFMHDMGAVAKCIYLHCIYKHICKQGKYVFVHTYQYINSKDNFCIQTSKQASKQASNCHDNDVFDAMIFIHTHSRSHSHKNKNKKPKNSWLYTSKTQSKRDRVGE